MPNFLVRTLYKNQGRAYLVFDEPDREAAKKAWENNHEKYHNVAEPELIRTIDEVKIKILPIL